MTKKEHYWILFYDSVNTGYNETAAEYKCGGNTYRCKTPEEMEIIKEKIRQSKLGGKNPHSRAVKVINIITGETKIYQSIQECVDGLCLNNHTAISRRCRGFVKSPLNGIYNFEYYNG